MHVYGPRDLAGGTSQMGAGDYVCYSAALTDSVHWECEGVIFRRDQDPFARMMTGRGDRLGLRSHLFAPDVVEIKGEHYLYYGVGLPESGIAMVVADSPRVPSSMWAGCSHSSNASAFPTDRRERLSARRQPRT